MNQEQWNQLVQLVSLHGPEGLEFETNHGETLIYEDAAFIEAEGKIVVLLD